MISPGTDFLSDSNQLLSARPNKSDDCAGPLRKKLCLQNDKDIPYRTSINSRVITSPPIMATGNVNPETLAALHRLAMGKNTEKDRNDLISFFGPNTKESLILTLKLETIDNILKEIDIESIPDHQRTYEHHVIAYLHGYNLTLRKRSDHFEHQTLCKLACWNSGKQLEFVPRHLITPELCEIACRNNGNALKFVPEELITYELCEIACQNHGSALRYVPKHLITSELCKIALQHNISNLGYVPNDWVTPELCEITCRKNGWALNYVPKNLRTPELCEIACRKNGDAFQFVPEELKTPELCEIACQNSISALRYLSESLKTDAFLKRLCSQNLTIITMISKAWLEKNPDICNRFPEAQSRGECHPLIIANLPEKYLRNEQFLTSCDFSDRLLLGSLPEKYRTKNLCLLACRINGQNIQSVPEEFKTETLCFEAIKNGALLKNIPNELKKNKDLLTMACSTNEFNIEYVTDEMKTKELLLIANEKSAIRTADYIPQRFYACPEFQLTLEDRNTDISSFISTYKCEEEKLLALKRCALRGTQHLFSCLINPKLSLSLKAKLIEFINQPAVNPFPPMPNIVHYAEKINPDTFSIINPFIKDLLFHLYQAKDYAPLGLQEGRTLDAFVQSHLPCTYQEKIPAQFSDCQEVNVAGGRTLRISNAQDGATYYKFQRQDESLDELSREGLMHQYLSDTSLRNELKSQLPVFKQFIKVPLEHLPEAVNTFADALEITEAEGKKFVNVYCFEASEHYSTYAHVREPEAAKPCEKAEIGIKMACYDCGVLAAKGIFLTSTLPAFHNGSTRWSCLRGAIVSDLSSPGKFESWNTTATERPDFGWDGVRDLGDYEVFDQLNDYLVELSAIRSVHHPETMKQRLALANIICEYMIAATLLRARLQQTSPDYHYKNADAIEKTKQFTEATMDAFLSGYYSTESSDIRPNLQEMLQLNPPNYHAWLERTAKEILYWTATQSLSGSTETPVTGRHEMTDDPRQSVPDDYGQHLKEGFLSPELYPDLHKTFKRFPRDVTPENKTVDPGALHLGFFNSLFPLQALISGLTKMCSGIFSHSSAMSGHEVKKQAWFKNTGF